MNRVHPAGADPSVALSDYSHPWRFYFLATVIPWTFWFGAAWLSHLPSQTPVVLGWTLVLQLIGLAAPVGVVAWLLRDKPALRRDIRARLLWPRGAGPAHFLLASVLLPASALAGIAVSLLFGYSAEQFRLRDGFSFTSGLMPVWAILILAPILEELAWHSYGTDALAARMRLLTASVVFVVIWTLWHLPLALIKGYYHAELIESGWLHALNFPLSMIPFVVLMNWLYFSAGRSILVTIIFHATAGFANEIFLMDPDAKLFQTGLLLIVTVVIIRGNRSLFLDHPLHQPTAGAGVSHQVKNGDSLSLPVPRRPATPGMGQRAS